MIRRDRTRHPPYPYSSLVIPAQLLRLKYNNSIADALAELGRPEEIGRVFAEFQQYLYRVVA